MSKAQELQERGVQLMKQRDYEAAAKLFQQAHEAFLEEGKTDMAAEMQVNIGLVHRSLGENQQALELMQQAFRTFQELNDAKRSAIVLGNLGGVYVALGDREQAHNAYRQAADIFDELGEKEMYGQTLLAIGDLQVREGKLTVGAATYQVGLENIGNLSASQKVIRFLSGIVNRFSNRAGS